LSLWLDQENYSFIILTKEIAENMANQVGKRYVCTVCGAEFIVTRGGDGEMHCCGKKMEIKK
jgi:competence CoiA-like predicted nuclease